MADSFFGQVLVSLSVMGGIDAIPRMRHRPAVPRRESVGILLILAGGGLLGLLFLIAAAMHLPLPPAAFLSVAALMDPGACSLHWPVA